MSTDSAHTLRIELATALRERDEARSHSSERANAIDVLKTQLSIANDHVAAARRECEGLRKALTALLHEVEESGNGDARDFGWGHALKLTRAALAAPATAPGEETER